MIGRGATEYDKDILEQLKIKYSDSVTIDFDMLNEPCIFFMYKGPAEMVYKLSANGEYVRPMEFYCIQADNAIISFMEGQDKAIRQQKINELKTIKDINKFEQQREHFKDNGFVDNLPD